MATIEDALAALEADGYRPEVAGMIWMQGESDAYTPAFADAYELRLGHFIDRVRTDVETPDMRFVIGLIDCLGLCPYREIVRDAQAAVADADPLVSTIETEDLGRYVDDPGHYHGPGMRVMGERFANALLGEDMAQVSEPAFRLIGAYSYSYYGYFTVGYRFNLTRTVSLTDLGLFDLGADGLLHASDIGIWDAGSGDLLVTETLPASESDSSPLIGNFRYVAISPVTLGPGEYVIGAESFGASPDYYVYEAEHEAAAGAVWVEGRHLTGSSLSFPTEVVPGTADSSAWFGPNFMMRD
jgi:hypothetical protein